MKKMILIALGVSLFAVSCKKDDTPDPNNNNNNNGNGNPSTLLTTGTWRMVSSSSVMEYPAPVGTQTVDLFNLLPSCVKDNIYTFKTDNTMLTDEGPTKCDPSDPQQENVGDWELLSNNTKLRMIADGEDIVTDILTLNSTTLEVRYVTDYGGITATTTTKYTH